jgi:hypothetical protein
MTNEGRSPGSRSFNATNADPNPLFLLLIFNANPPINPAGGAITTACLMDDAGILRA